MNDEKYDYYENVKSDVMDFLEENYDHALDDREAQDAYDEAFVSDSVTGNASGSFYCSSWKAECALCHNSDLVSEMQDELGSPDRKDPETLDVCVRCHVLGQVFWDVVKEFNKKFP